MSNKSGDVLEEYDSRKDFTGDPCDGRPQPPLVLDPSLLPGATERLARKTRTEEIHASTPRFAVEGLKAVSDRSVRQARVRHPRHNAGRGIGIPLDVAHSSESGNGKSEPEPEGAGAGAEFKMRGR